MGSHDVEFSQSVRLGPGGRIVIPAALRRKKGWKTDEALRIRMVDGEVRIESVMDGIRRAQEIVARYASGGGSIVDELIADRRAENAKDEAETREWLSGFHPKSE